MEFKGTKGKWEWIKGHWHDTIGTNNGEIIICAIRQPSLSINEHDANALLISKAPEMLEMLKLVKRELNPAGELMYKIEQLIKQSTEL